VDPVLDVKPSAFGRTVDQLIAVLDDKNVSLSYDHPRTDGDSQQGSAATTQVESGPERKGSWTTSYQAEVARLPRLSRAEEFVMARRYAFLKARLAHVLAEGGVETAKIPEMLTSSFEDAGLTRSGGLTAARLRRIRRRYEELEELRNRFVEGTLYIVLRSVHRYRGLGIDTPDLIQEGNASLFQAVEGFDWTRDVRFKTYAEYWINQAFLKILYNNVRTVRIPVWVQKALKKIQTLRERNQHSKGTELTSEQIGKALGMPAEKVDSLLRTHRYAVSLDAEVGGEDGGRMGDLLADKRVGEMTDTVQDVSLKDRLAEVMADLPDREKLILKMRFGLDGEDPSTLSEVGEILAVSAERVRQLQEAALRRLKIPRKMRQLETFAS
jgi:RNA polymerase sigma factor (sigma-70 family)